MPEQYQSMSHSKWDCKYHVVFILGATFHELARRKLRLTPNGGHLRAPYSRRSWARNEAPLCRRTLFRALL
jgi:hypothetical protein